MTFKRDLMFFDVEPEGCRPDQILSRINAMPANDSDTGNILSGDGYSITMIGFRDATDYTCGVIGRYRTDDLPACGDPSQRNVRQIPINPNEGIVDMTYFHYDKSLGIMCLLSGNSGIKYGIFSWYVKKKGSEPSFNLLPLLRKDANDAFRRLGKLTSIAPSIKIGNGFRSNSRLVQNLPVGAMLSGAKDQLHGSIFKFEILNSKRRGGLIIGTARKLVSGIIGLAGPGAEVVSLKVKGSQDAHSRDVVLDLIEQKHKVTLELTGSGRRLDFGECEEVVSETINQTRSILSELIS